MSSMPAAIPTYVLQKTRDAILPVEYTSACKAIAACRGIDETKYWSDKADALAAWAKIYKNNQAAVESKRLKLHAYRRMSQLADELQPDKRCVGSAGQMPGPRALLIQNGLSREQAKTVRRIGAIPKKRFERIVASPKPPGLYAAAALGIGESGRGHKTTSSDAWRTLAHGNVIAGVNLRRFLTLFCNRNSAKDLARGLLPGEVLGARKLLTEIQEWLDEFEQYLPKVKP
jgi:hypothetical protein